MFNLNEGNRYFLCSQGVDLLKGLNGLCGVIRHVIVQSDQRIYLCKQNPHDHETVALGTWRFCHLLISV